MNFRGLVRAVASVMLIAVPALATSTIDPTRPLTSMPYSSAPIRNNFQAAYNDINALQTCNAGVTAPSAPQSGYCWLDTSGGNTAWVYRIYDGITSQWVPICTLNPTATNASCTSPTSVTGLGVVLSNAALKALSVATLSAGTMIFRAGFYAVGDGGAAAYTYSTSNCSLNGGNGDNGSQVPPPTGGCWNIVPMPRYDWRIWGVKIEAAGGYVPTPVDPAGTFDSTSAIQAALNTGFSIFAPPGRFHITDKLTCGGNDQQISGAGRVYSIIDVGSDFNMSATAAFDPAPSSITNQVGCELHNIGFQFYQNTADTSPSQLIQYPWAISASSPPARIILDNVELARCWNGISLQNNFAPIMNGVMQLGCFNIPLYMDGSLDYSFINQMEVWPFGSEGSGNLLTVWRTSGPTSTGPTVYIGRSDGLTVNNFVGFFTNINITANNLDNPGLSFNTIHLNGTTGGVTVNSGALSIGNFEAEVNAPALIVQGPMPFATGAHDTIVTVSHCKCLTSSTTGFIANHGGTLNILGGTLLATQNNATALTADDSFGNSRTMVSNLIVNLGGSNIFSPIIKQSGANAGLTLNHIQFTQDSGSPDGFTGTVVSVTTDNAFNHLSDIDASMWGNTAVTVNLGSGPGPVLGYYDLPDHTFNMTMTPHFLTAGDFAPANNTPIGYYWLRGNYVDFDIREGFDTNAYTTASGGFYWATNLPIPNASAIALNVVQIALTPTEISNFVLSSGYTQTAFGLDIADASPSMAIYPEQAGSGHAWSQMGITNVPASTTGFFVSLHGRYRIK